MMAAIRMSEPQTPQAPGLSEWIESHQTWLWRYLRFLGAASDVAEDACQETLLAALHHQIPDREHGVAISWLRTTACNFYRKQLRRSRQQEAMQQLLARDAMVTTDDLLHRAAGNEHRDSLRACLQLVTGDARELLDMRYRDNASRKDMAASTGRSEEGIKTLLRRVKTQLRECIEQRRTQ
tara:strand:- start:6386 stop:6928 length:543 start_codon:yes stop_codon:yes gene_type:complete